MLLRVVLSAKRGYSCFTFCNKRTLKSDEQADRRGRFCNFASRYAQLVMPLFVFYARQMQTNRKTTKECGMLHLEGGWPKEINVKDEEAVMRFRRRVEKDEYWAPRMKKLTDVSRFEISYLKYTFSYQNVFLLCKLLSVFFFYSKCIIR